MTALVHIHASSAFIMILTFDAIKLVQWTKRCSLDWESVTINGNLLVGYSGMILSDLSGIHNERLDCVWGTVLWKIFGCKKEGRENYIMRNLMDCTSCLLFGWLNQIEFERKIWNWYKILVGRPEWKWPLMRPRHKWKNNIKMNYWEIGCIDWTGFNWPVTGSSVELLWNWWWRNFMFHKIMKSGD